MRLIPLTTPDTSSLLPAASGHCRIDPTTPAQDASVAALLAAAVDFVEGETGQQLFNRQYVLHLDGFPAGDVVLPKPPLRSVDSVSYMRNGVETSLPEAQYVPDPAGSRPGRLRFVGELPAVDDVPSSVLIEFTAGYGEAADELPAVLKQAVLLTFGHWFEHREAAIDRRVDELPMAVRSIVAQHEHPEVV